MVGLAASGVADRFFPQILLSMRSFGPLSDEHRAEVETHLLRVVLARAGDDIIRLGDRTENILAPGATALLNGLYGNETFDGGELIKIIRREKASTR
jgi:predicted Zn-dependent protease